MKVIFIFPLAIFFAVKTFAQTKITKAYYPNGKIKYVTYSKADKSERMLLFRPNGKLEKEANLKNNKSFGLQIEYDSLGRKITESFVIGVDQIPYKLINDTVTNEYLVDAVSSKETNYFQNGNKKSEGYIINACKIGLWIYYNDDGTLRETKFYKTLKINE